MFGVRFFRGSKGAGPSGFCVSRPEVALNLDPVREHGFFGVQTAADAVSST